MGGSGGGSGGGGLGPSYSPASARLDQLEEIARRALRAPEAERPRRVVFMSYRYRDSEKVDDFRQSARTERFPIELTDFSLSVPFDSDDAEYIRRGIRRRIQQSSVTLVAVGSTTYQSKWVDWEIRESRNSGKGIVAFKLDSGADPPIPSALRELGIPLLPKDNTLIGNAIEQAAAQRWNETSGTPDAP